MACSIQPMTRKHLVCECTSEHVEGLVQWSGFLPPIGHALFRLPYTMQIWELNSSTTQPKWHFEDAVSTPLDCPTGTPVVMAYLSAIPEVRGPCRVGT